METKFVRLTLKSLSSLVKKKPVKSGLKKPIKPYSDSTKVHKNETRIFNK